MSKKLLITPIFIFFLSGCGGSSTPANMSSSTIEEPTSDPVVEQPTVTDPIPPIVVDDITCEVSYPLSISKIEIESSGELLPQLFDLKKTEDSIWQPTNIDNNIIIELASPALLKSLVLTWQDQDNSHLFNIQASKDKENWQLLDTVEQSEKQKLIPDLIDLIGMQATGTTALYLKVALNGNELSQPSDLLELELYGCEEDINHNIELIDWYLSVPTDEDGNNKSDSIKENDLSAGYFDARFFSLSKDQGLTFTTSVSGYKTSTNTKYVRSELREMLRRGNSSHSTQGVNQNNWVFSSAPQSDLDNAGGIDGELHAEVAVNHVTTTGESYQIGRVIIGQIHANDDEPIRLYYRKLPGNVNGSLYFAHEILDGDDIYYELIGDRSNTASNPVQGIPLNEKFQYSIIVKGNELTAVIIKADGSEFSQTIDMSESGYDQGGQYMYFKAGVYNQNNSGDKHDYVQATFYQIENSHTGYLNAN